MLPLTDITILSLAEQLPGPYATLVLRDLGADVIMVERPRYGDPVRMLPGLFASTARGKRSVALDLKHSEGRAAFLRVAERADVVIEGFRPGTVDRLGVGYDDVRAVNDRIVYVSLSGFGQDGPYRERPAHDVVNLALAGFYYDGHVDPTGVPAVPVGDMASGTFAVVAILTGLLGRERTGVGSYIDLAMTDSLISWLGPLLGGRHPIPPPIAGYGVYPTADGALALGIAFENHLWQDLCRACGVEELADLDATSRRERRAELDERLREVFRGRTTAEWDRILGEASIAYGPVLDLDGVADDPQVVARDLLIGSPPWSARQPLAIKDAPVPEPGDVPALGQHTREVLLAAGLTEAEVDELVGARVAAAA